MKGWALQLTTTTTSSTQLNPMQIVTAALQQAIGNSVGSRL
jgi:hypothetical protein